ncbi:MAG TPA: bifunctional methylenetetrahydrofolate dehydrogenase/methenyltetrahydrofolate cyclohydrolase FolD [Methanospirillum sp.]|uniref:bifunctional methylenetetrahydrofolate dehydrogenase/methenyltetrahydrofolate cyclohydrolase FolD n=1 Tax=Methanospirillum sp. TaxID=45200 RepID=UPI002C96A543|nr:bifunctional methylenetetrahydrofolate dehydrogenase/methenyltetrahydrofolate cyclohydrolase FolD [Methanospirillum sp.]HWQ62976.1 bifunctional methylenetetrahydrofolate dehydrogenase/methenyltetrahydrofolate cyclohydrolase FolD [Methanospirillum sp.]
MILDGKGLADRRLELLKEDIRKRGIIPTLATVLVGDDSASAMYVRMKHRACDQIGIKSVNVQLPGVVTTSDVLDRLKELNEDPDIDGILVQLPLPSQIDTHQVINSVSPEKDVDGYHPINMGKLVGGLPGPRSCTPKGIMTILKEYGIQTSGAHAVVIGRSVDVGRPMALLLVLADATVTICHSKTRDLASITKQADIIISAAGKADMVTADMVKPGATVIDVGTNHVNGKLRGDVDFEAVSSIAGAITPVPGGVGPMTIASLMENTLEAALSRCKPAQ